MNLYNPAIASHQSMVWLLIAVAIPQILFASLVISKEVNFDCADSSTIWEAIHFVDVESGGRISSFTSTANIQIAPSLKMAMEISLCSHASVGGVHIEIDADGFSSPNVQCERTAPYFSCKSFQTCV